MTYEVADLPDTVVRSMHYNAKSLHRRFPMVDHDDIAQEMWLWALQHPRKVNHYLAEGEDNRYSKLCWAMRNAGLAYCQKEKAKRNGYSVDDLYFYSLRTLREILPAVYDDDMWIRLGGGDCDPANGINPDPSRPDRRMDAIAALTDVKNAVNKKLRGDLRQLIEWTFRDGFSDEQLAGHLHTTPAGARMRVQRALRKLQGELGGERPDWRAASAAD